MKISFRKLLVSFPHIYKLLVKYFKFFFKWIFENLIFSIFLLIKVLLDVHITAFCFHVDTAPHNWGCVRFMHLITLINLQITFPVCACSRWRSKNTICRCHRGLAQRIFAPNLFEIHTMLYILK